MQVEVLETISEVEAMRAAWERLADDVGTDVFSRPTWCVPWWEHLGRGRLAVHVVRDGAALAAVAPVAVQRRAGLELVRFLGHGLGTVSEVLVAPGRDDAASALWGAALAGRRRVVDLVEHRDGGHGLDALLARTGTTVRVARRDRCPVISLDGLDGVDDLLATRSKGLRRTLRNGRARALEAGGHEVEVVTDGPRLHAVLPEVVRVVDAAEAAKPRLHFLAGEVGAFTRALLRRAADEGRLRLFVGRIGGRAVSVDIAFATGDRLSLWAGRFDPAAAGTAPGHLALAAIVADAHRAGLRSVDLLLGDDEYKRRWTVDGYDTVEVRAADHRHALALSDAVSGAGRAAANVRRTAPAAAAGLVGAVSFRARRRPPGGAGPGGPDPSGEQA